MKYLAYFQSYSNSYGTLSHLKELYEEALRVPDVVGLVIGTRPDCMPDALLEYLEELNRRTFLLVEYGVESANEETLVRVNRGHTFAQARECIIRTAQRGIRVGVHMILGFPWETRSELIRQAQLIASLPITTLISLVSNISIISPANTVPIPSTITNAELMFSNVLLLPSFLLSKGS